MASLTWGVNSRDQTATIFCNHCRAVLAVVPVVEAGWHRDKLEQQHHCTPHKPCEQGRG